MRRAEIMSWLEETSQEKLGELWREADMVRREHVGDAVHLRGLVEISNYCVRQCTYCGIRVGNKKVQRYRMSADEILECARRAVQLGYGTLVMQAGEDYGLTRQWVGDLVRRIKTETPLAVTLSLGERSDEDLLAWRQSGADRYLLRFETSDLGLYAAIHPQRAGQMASGDKSSGGPDINPLNEGQTQDRIGILARLREFGYEIGSGIMVGIPGQTLETIAEDLLLFESMDLDMIGIGPYIPDPDTPLAKEAGCGDRPSQAPADETTVLKVVAMARLLCPEANIPATTALGTINRQTGRANGLVRGANIVMPNLTPATYREKYVIYPQKASIDVTSQEGNASLCTSIKALGRTAGTGTGSRRQQARSKSSSSMTDPNT